MTSDDPRHHTTLRPEHAFVVQFNPATQVDAGQVEGRVVPYEADYVFYKAD